MCSKFKKCLARVYRRLPTLATAGRQSRPFAFAIASTLACTFSPAGQTASGSLSIRYQNDAMDFWIDDRPLKQVIEALERASGVRVVLIDPAITAWPVSGAARGVSLEEGLKTILHGFSYAFHRGNPRPTLVVLATQPGPRRTSDPGVELSPEAALLRLSLMMGSPPSTSMPRLQPGRHRKPWTSSARSPRPPTIPKPRISMRTPRFKKPNTERRCYSGRSTP